MTQGKFEIVGESKKNISKKKIMKNEVIIKRKNHYHYSQNILLICISLFNEKRPPLLAQKILKILV